VSDSSLAELLKNQESWKSLSTLQKQDWANDLNNSIKAAVTWEELQKEL
jgi:hypothetical protein